MNIRNLFLAIVPFFFSTVAAAQTYPVKPIRIIVPFGAGTQSDVLGRLVGQKLTEAWSQQVVIENRPGAGAIIGTELAAKAVPDGYTLSVNGTGALAINPGLYPKLPYDPIRDFAPVTRLVSVTQTLDRKSTRLNSSHSQQSRMPSSA